jgi:tRNA threonylcarbamoyladenosine biosynthesis protein TsaE
MQREYISHSVQETLSLGITLGQKARPGDIFALYGDLGAGKTVLAKGIARGLGIQEEITSPSYALQEIYPCSPPLFHFDLYRISGPQELDLLCFEEYWEDDGVSVIEWAERARERIPVHAVWIRLEYLQDSARRITIEYPDH